MKKSLKYLGIALGIFLILLILAPFLFKKQIVKKIKLAANEQLNATIDFNDNVSFGFIRSFPNANLGLSELSVIGKESYEGDTLAFADRIDLVVDVMSLFKGEAYQIRKVSLKKPYVQLLVDSAGRANWDILKKDTTAIETASASSFHAALQQYTISDGHLIYHDTGLGFYMEADQLDHTGKGDFTQDVFDLSTVSHAGAFTISYAGIPYLNKMETEIESDINIDLNQWKYSLANTFAKFNGLTLGLDGYLAMPEDDIVMDLSFETLDSDFKNFLSLIPAIYQKDFDDLKASGRMSLNGYVKGIYNEHRIPGFQVNLAIDDGMFQYPSLPEALTDVHVDLTVNNEDGNVDHTLIDVKKLHFQMGNNPFNAHLTVRNPTTDPLMEGALKGKLNLSDIAKVYPLEDATTFSGMLDMDIQVKGRLSAIENKKYDQFQAKGQVLAQELIYKTASFQQPVDISKATLYFSPQEVKLVDLAMQIGRSNLQADGTLDNFFGYLFGKDNLKGRLDVRSRLLDLNEIMGADGSATTDTTSGVEAVIIPRNIAFHLNTNIDRFIYDTYDLQNVRGKVEVEDGILTIQNAQADLLDGNTQLKGTYNTQDPETPKIDFTIHAQRIDIRKAFETFTTVKFMAPVAAFVQGNFSGDISLSAPLNKNLFPQLTSINSMGKIDIPNLEIKNFAPLQEMASSLGITALKDMALQRLNLHFEVKDGYIHVKPFDFSVEGIKINVFGKNGLNKDIDYTLDLEIPRDKLGDVNNALTKMITQANQATGSNITLGETVTAQVQLGGTITKPKIKLDLSEEKTRMETVLKEEAKGKLKDEADRLISQLFKGNKDTTTVVDTSGLKEQEEADPQEGIKDALKKRLKDLLKKKDDG